MSPLLYKFIDCNMLGRYYLPRRRDVKGGVLLLHGSEGGGFGFHDVEAQLLACHGFAALAFTWCGSPAAPVKGAPPDVIDIDLELTLEALGWLRNRSELKRKRIALYGISRGAEQALILAALSGRHSGIPKPDALCVHAPTDKYVQGFSWNWESVGGSVPDDPAARAWRWRGRYVGTVGKPIPVEQFNGPVLLSHGIEDEIWSVERTKRLEKRLVRAQKSVEAHYIAAEKHQLSASGIIAHRAKLVEFLERTLQ